MKSKIKGCIHHKSKVLKMEEGGAVTPAVMPPATGGGKMAPLVDRLKSFASAHPGMGARSAFNMTAGRTRFPANPTGQQGTQDRPWKGQKGSQWKNTGPTMVNKNTA